VDLICIIPWFVGLGTGEDLPMFTPFRILRMFRLLKYTRASESLTRVLKRNREVLVVGASLSITLLLFTGTVLYFTWKDQDPVYFGSIPKTMFLGVLMLTGQGISYDDGPTPFSALMMFVVSLTAVISVGIFLIPWAMIAWGFEREAERLYRLFILKESAHREARIKFMKQHGVPYTEVSSDDDDSDSDSEEQSAKKGASLTAIGMTSLGDAVSADDLLKLFDANSASASSSSSSSSSSSWSKGQVDTLLCAMGDTHGQMSYAKLLVQLAATRAGQPIRRIDDGKAGTAQDGTCAGAASTTSSSGGSVGERTTLDKAAAIAVLRSLSAAERFEAIAAIAGRHIPRPPQTPSP